MTTMSSSLITSKCLSTRRNGMARKGAYGLAWETPTRVIDRATAKYEELSNLTRHRHPFDRLTLWHHNIFPIQAVLFHRSLYERYGGFAEDMEQLEDWNLWTRYTLEDDFVLVEKTTSKYRVPATAREAAARQTLLDRAYRDAVERQKTLRLLVSPQDIARMADAHMRSQSLLMVGRPCRAPFHRRAAVACPARRVARTDHAPVATAPDYIVSDGLEFTGERFLPGARGEIWYEHWHRYHFAAKLVAGRVLDVACGAGYGSALLARQAQRVVGVDISAATIAHARAAYAATPNLEFGQADCAALPFADATFDVVVSFETIEHIERQVQFLDEVRRVLRQEGLLVLSCPNKLEYSDRRVFTNPYHVREFYRDELAALLAPRFSHVLWFGQRMSFFSVVWPEQRAAEGDIFEVSETSATAATAGHSRPLYFIVAASRSAQTIATIPPRLSVLADRDERVYADYAQAFVNEKIQWDRGNTLDGVVAEWQGHFREAVGQRDALEKTVRELSEQIALRVAECARLAAVIDAQQHEIERRASVRWWLALPWRRLAAWLAPRK